MNKIDYIVREFHAQYGLAMNTVQIIERGLLELFSLQKYIDSNITEQDYYKILSNPHNWTLGQIKGKIIELEIFDNVVVQVLNEINKNRIFLAHRFWWERNIEFNSIEKLEQLNEEILTYINAFNELLVIIDKKINKIRTENNINIEEKMGLTNFEDRLAYINKLRK
jgi:hypothetical protein